MNRTDHNRIAVFSAGLLFSKPLRRVIRAAGFSISSGWSGVWARSIGVWGRIPMSRRVLARWKDSPVVTFEDAFLRSVLPGLGSPPIGLNIDDVGVHFDARSASKLESILEVGDLDCADLLQRAANGRAFLHRYGLSKYNPAPRGYGICPKAGYVLVIDQVAGDASIVGGMAEAGTFREMLATARAENPDTSIVVRTHPAIGKGGKQGHFRPEDLDENSEISCERLNPWDLLEGAARVYCVSSQMGFDAILAGHRPEVFGVPFYAGWGLTTDRQKVTRRTRILCVDQLFAGAMLVYPFWYNHARNCACEFEEAAQQLLAQAKHHWDGLQPITAVGMRRWKRKNVALFLPGGGQSVAFINDSAKAVANAQKRRGKIVVWAGRETADLSEKCRDANVPLVRMEDGFLRSTGLGAALTPAASLVLDSEGIYYDPNRPSELETLIASSVNLPEVAVERAVQLRAKLCESGVSKYNLVGEELPELPINRQVILVVGQVADDASIRLGAGEVKTDLALLKMARNKNAKAFIIYRPHPDVVAGLRQGSVPEDIARYYCDLQVPRTDVNTLIAACDEVWTITSLLGFEALLRGKQVVCLGTPFYAGWGQTNDLARVETRRDVEVSLDQLVHATLIDYPRYLDPVSKLPCTAELIVERLAVGATKKPPALRALAKLQGVFASYATIWR